MPHAPRSRAALLATCKRLFGVPVAAVLRSVLRLSARRSGLVIYYHGIRDGVGAEHELIPTPTVSLFEAQVRHVAAHYNVVAPSAILEAARARRRGQRFPVAITFDDDLQSHTHNAAPILRRAGVPAGFFLCGASLEQPYSFWWERLERAVRKTPDGVAGVCEVLAEARSIDLRGAADIHDLAQRIEALPPSDRARVAAALATAAGPDPPLAGLRADGVASLAGEGFEVGFHTLRHDALCQLEPDELAEAMRRGRGRLAGLVGEELTMIAYPHGSADARVAAAAEDAGYVLGFTCAPQPVTSTADRFLVGRVEALATSLGAFALRLVRILAR